MDSYETEEEKKEKGLDIHDIMESVNVAELLSDKHLEKMGINCFDGYKLDLESRKDFDKLLDKWTKLAIQISEDKSYPWPKASNVKYPLLAIASMQFAARAYPSLVPSNGQVVKVKVLGYDRDGMKRTRADRVSKFMSWQLMDEMEEWEEEHDRLLITLPVVGTMFKKTYWDSMKQRNVSCLVMPKELIVNYWAKNLNDVERITEIHYMSARKIQEKIRTGLYLDVDLGEPVISSDNQTQEMTTNPSQLMKPSRVDHTTPFTILEQHCYCDLDKDGYAEPYIVTFEENSKKVLRVVARFTPQGVVMNEDNEVAYITAQQYYTKYGFVPNPDGGFYDIGFGRLLGTVNEAVDTLINQVIDGGSMSNLQAGFIAKGLRMKMGETRFTPGEWKHVNATGQDLKAGIFPLPTREPSAILMNLVTFLVTSGKELASVAEIMVGKMPGQNTPATTTMASIEQGMKVFTAIYKRVFRSMTQEFRKLYQLNKTYLNPETEVEFSDEPMPKSDFDGPENDILPAADPASVSAQEKQAKATAVMQLLPLGTVDPVWATQQYFEAFEIPGGERGIRTPEPKPDPEAEKIKLEAQIESQEASQRIQGEAQKQKIREAEAASKAREEKVRSDMKIKNEAILGSLKVRNALQEGGVKRLTAAQQHAQKMAQASEKHALAMRQAAEKKAATAKKGKTK